MKPLALWAVPRSVSTAFERMVEARGDFAVLSEPFSVSYYFSDARVSNRYRDARPREEYTPRCVLTAIHRTAEKTSVFFKDMAYHARDFIDPAWVGDLENTFIVRHPRRTLPSLHRLLPDFTLEETGFDQQWRLFNLVRDLTGEAPPLIDGDDLRADPAGVVTAYCRAVDIPFEESALRWDPELAPRWKTWSRWHAEVAASEGFVSGGDPEPLDSLRRERPGVYEHCVQVYEALIANKLTVGRSNDLESTFVAG